MKWADKANKTVQATLTVLPNMSCIDRVCKLLGTKSDGVDTLPMKLILKDMELGDFPLQEKYRNIYFKDIERGHSVNEMGDLDGDCVGGGGSGNRLWMING